MADLAADWTPFRYGFNNPMTFSDPSGMMETSWDGQQSASVTTGTVTPFTWTPGGQMKTGVDGAKMNNADSKTTSASGSQQSPSQMATINVTTLNLPPIVSPDLMGPGIQAITCGPASAPETVSPYESTFWDAFAVMGTVQRTGGDYLGTATAIDMTYNYINDNYTSYNWVIHKESYDLRGVQVGYTKAVRCATFSWASILSLPLGWMGEGGEVATKGFESLSDLGLSDGMETNSREILDLAERFLGKGYSEPIPGSGRFVSADGTRVFRMGESDIMGLHGGGPHVNFETLTPNPAKPGKMIVDQNYHIYLSN